MKINQSIYLLSVRFKFLLENFGFYTSYNFSKDLLAPYYLLMSEKGKASISLSDREIKVFQMIFVKDNKTVMVLDHLSNQLEDHLRKSGSEQMSQEMSC